MFNTMCGCAVGRAEGHRDWIVYGVLFFLLILIGAAEIIVTQLKIEKVYKMVIVFSILLGIAAVLFLALTGETYATALAFLLLVLKAGLYMKGR